MLQNSFREQAVRHLRALFNPQSGLIWACVLCVLVLAGPFGTMALLDPVPRAAFWCIVVAVSVLLGCLARAAVFSLVPAARRLAQEAMVVAVLVLLLSPKIWWLMQTLSGQSAADILHPGFIAFYVCIIASSVIALRYLVPAWERRLGRSQPPGAGGDEGDAPPSPRLMNRLGRGTTGPILRLSGQDHHVEVVTQAGSQMLRMRLVDAIQEMEPIEGHCTHRSHWVARAAIARIDRDSNQKIFVVLTNGDRVPVSRKYRSELEQAGIL